MFYSRPNIAPLGWDLVALPTPNGSRNFDAITSDGRPIDVRFSSGWLTVERGQPGAGPDSEMEEVLSLQISPFGVIDISPAQICDILGLTVNGAKIDVAELWAMELGSDWTGRTTYWFSSHLMLWGEDAETFTQKISRAFPGSVLVQARWGSGLEVRCRQIKFFMNTDEIVTFGVTYDNDRLQKMLAAERVPNDEFEAVLKHRITFISQYYPSQDLTGRTFIVGKGADKLDLDYVVTASRRYDIRMEYLTDDTQAQSIMNKLLAVINDYFCRGFQIVNLQNRAILGVDLDDEEDTRSYSKNFRDWCLEAPNRYLFVSTLSRTIAAEPFTFIGYRPLSV
jgi:hypothetical protein